MEGTAGKFTGNQLTKSSGRQGLSSSGFDLGQLYRGRQRENPFWFHFSAEHLPRISCKGRTGYF